MQQKSENPRLAWALWYAEKMNFSVIPIVPGDKRPLVKWEPYQQRRASSEQIREWWTQTPNANIGIVTGAISDLAVIDVDSEEGRKNIEAILPESFVTPMVHTPRGGMHYYCRMPQDGGEKLRNKAGLIPGTDFRGEGGYVVAPISANGNGKAYRWAEASIGNTPLTQLPDAYIRILINNKIINNSFYGGDYKGGEKGQQQALRLLQLLQEGTRDNDLFHIFNCLSKGGYEKELAYKLAEIIADNCRPPFPKDEAIAKVDSAYRRSERKVQNLTQAVRDWVALQERYICVTDCYSALQLLHHTDQTNCRVILHRLCKDGVLERVSQGVFQKIDQDCPDIDFWNADISPLDIRYPFGIENFINTYPKNIIVVAGEPNAGKTALLLNIAKMNMDNHEVVYFSSEMGAIELKNRLQKFELPMEVWRKVAWKERSADFAPLIRPDAINIIDFLEVHEDFYKVGLHIKRIFEKLDKGIAVIAIQKPKGRDEGMGGQRGLENPRLYLAMEPGKIKIVKAKNWRYETINPNGMSLRWKLVAGCRFKKDGDWEA